jgi:hypothetical protein
MLGLEACGAVMMTIVLPYPKLPDTLPHTLVARSFPPSPPRCMPWTCAWLTPAAPAA